MTSPAQVIAERLAAIEDLPKQPSTIADWARVAEAVVRSLGANVVRVDSATHHELITLIREIRTAREEIAALRPDEINGQHIPRATDELDAIVLATEDATNRIMSAAETIEAAAGESPPELGAKLTEAVTNIYEACGFQDITGQRVSKVVKALRTIEERICKLVETMGPQSAIDAAKARPAPTPTQPTGAHKEFLNGPALQGEGRSQEEIDALLSDFK